MIRLVRFFCSIFLLACWAATPMALPRPSGFVVDESTLLSPLQTKQLESASVALEKASGIEVATVVLNTTNGEPIEMVAERLYKQWGIGKKGQDNGVLFVTALREKQTRIEVGYGLESILNDGKTGELLDRYVIPFYKAKRFQEGVLSGHLAIIETIATAKNITLSVNKPVQTQQKMPLELLVVIVILVMALIVSGGGDGVPLALLAMLLGSGTNGRGSGGFGGFGGGGFGGFGGGLSGGGGASRDW